jgi:YidC/Oxa1 family membrane protein insertase
VIYWAWSNTLSILQQSYIMKKNGVEVDFFGNIRDSLPFLKKKPAS